MTPGCIYRSPAAFHSSQRAVGPVPVIFEDFVGVDGLVEAVIEGFNALDKPG